MKSVTTTDIL